MSLNIKNKIIKGCLELFFKYGIKSISVDDISGHLGISKKTFYQHFENKNDIIKAIANEFINRNRLWNKEIIEEKTDVFDKLIKIYKKMLSQFSTRNPRFIYDIKKYHSEVYRLFIQFIDNDLEDIITKLIKQGKVDGVFRNEIDEHIIFKLHINRINAIIEGLLLPEKFITDPVFIEILIIDLIGMTTTKGHEILEKKLNVLPNE